MKTKSMIPALIAVTFIASACSGVMDSAQPARQVYMLMPVAGAAAGLDVSKPGLSISLTAVPGLDTDRVQALGSDATLTRYANARWPDNLPEVLTSVLQRSLAASGDFSVVEASSRAGAAGWKLNLEVQKFYGLQNADGSTSAVAIELSGSVDCQGSRGVFTLSDTVSVGSQRLASVVAAHQQGLDSVTRQLITKITSDCT